MLFEQGADGTPIHPTVALRAWRPHGSALAAVEHPELQRGHVRRAPHDSAEGVDLSNDSALCNTSDRGVARHLANALDRTRYETNSSAKARSCDRGFGACMASADDDNVEFVFQRNRAERQHEKNTGSRRTAEQIFHQSQPPNDQIERERPNMPLAIPAGQAMLFIRREAYERAGITRVAIDQRLNLTPDEFTVEGQLVIIGPLPDEAVLRDLFDELEEAGLAYFDDYFELSGNWPSWLRLYASDR